MGIEDQGLQSKGKEIDDCAGLPGLHRIARIARIARIDD
jgi:hypothetical protein